MSFLPIACVPDPASALQRLNSRLMQLQLHAGTSAYRASENDLAEELIAHHHLLAPAVARLVPGWKPAEVVAEILPDILSRISAGTFHWFSLCYLKTAVRIRARQLRRDFESHLSLDDETLLESMSSSPAPGEPLPEFAEREVRTIYRRFLADLSPEKRRLLRLARRLGRPTVPGARGHRQGWQKEVAKRLGRPPCWVTRNLNDLFRRLAAALGRPDLKHRKGRKADDE